MKEGNKKANGHLDVPHYSSADVPPEPLNGVTSPEQEGSVLEMHTGLFALGWNRARQSGTIESRSEDENALSNHARAMAKQTYRDKFDPSANVHDTMQKAEYDRLFAQRADAEMAERQAAANLRDTEIALARTPTAGPKPCAHPLLVAAFTVAITVTVAPTLHDLLAVNDDILAWFLAAVSSGLVAFMVTSAILSGRRSKWEWVGVTAGVILGIGLCAVRFSSASDAGGIGIAVGLTIVEIATVLLIEWVASGLRVRDAEWLPTHAAEAEATSARDAALADHARWKTKAKELDDAIDSKIALVEERHNRNIHLSELEMVAINAVMDGYNAGITENIGILRGVRRRPA